MLHTINSQTENVNNNNRIDGGDANDNLSMRFISMVQYRKQPVLIGSPLDSMFGDNERHSNKVMRLNSCSKSRVNINKKCSDTKRSFVYQFIFLSSNLADLG